MAADEWIGVIHSTRPDYIKGAVDLTIRNRLFLSMLRRKGRIELNQNGYECTWQLRFAEPPVDAIADGAVIDFSNHDAHRQITVDWRGLVAQDMLTMKQNAMNAGQTQLVNLFQVKTNYLEESIRNRFCGELFKDGEASGRENNPHGLETFMASGTTVVGDILAEPSDTYGLGSLSTAPGGVAGSWSTGLSTSPNANLGTDWPNGQGDSSYDFNSPKLLNWSSNAWGTASVLWEDNCWRAISQAITWLTTTGGPDGMPDICLLAPDLFQGYKNHEEAIRRINVPHRIANDLGFAGNTLNQDGCAISSDYDVPVNTGYMVNCSKMTISSLMPDLFWMKGPDMDPRTLWSYLWAVGFWGNVKFNPKHTAKLYNYADS